MNKDEQARLFYQRLTQYGTTHNEFMAQEAGQDLFAYRLSRILAELAQSTNNDSKETDDE